MKGVEGSDDGGRQLEKRKGHFFYFAAFSSTSCWYWWTPRLGSREKRGKEPVSLIYILLIFAGGRTVLRGLYFFCLAR